MRKGKFNRQMQHFSL